MLGDRFDLRREYRRAALEKPSDEELAVLITDAKAGEARAIDRLTRIYMPFITRMASRYANGRDLQKLNEVTQYAAWGFIESLRTYDSAKSPLEAHAFFYVRKQVYQYFRENGSMVARTHAQAKISTRVKALKKELRVEGHLSVENALTIAEMLECNPDDVLAVDRQWNRDVSFNAPLRAEDAASAEMQDLHADDSLETEEDILERLSGENSMWLVQQALKTLNPRARAIFENRYLTDPQVTCEALSHVYGVTPQRIDQIAHRALKKVSKFVRFPYRLSEVLDAPDVPDVSETEENPALEAIQEALETLDDMERDVFEKRYMRDEPMSLRDLAKLYDVRMDAMYQIATGALEKVKQFVEQEMGFPAIEVSRDTGQILYLEPA